jgi:hypothetical protein
MSGPSAQSQSDPTFDVALIKLNKSNEGARINAMLATGRLVITGLTVHAVIAAAYGVQEFEIVNDNSLVLKQRIDIGAKVDRPLASTARCSACCNTCLRIDLSLPFAANRSLRLVSLESEQIPHFPTSKCG